MIVRIIHAAITMQDEFVAVSTSSVPILCLAMYNKKPDYILEYINGSIVIMYCDISRVEMLFKMVFTEVYSYE